MRKVGLDINRPIDLHTGTINPTINPHLASDVAWARVNFVLGPWQSPDDVAWRSTYDDVVNRYVDRDIQVYGLIGHEAVRAPFDTLFQEDHPAPEPPEAGAWIDPYIHNFLSIVSHFRGRVRCFESFNEPNNWHQGRPWVSPYWFAKMIGAIYRAVKLDAGFDDVTLITGPLFSHNINDQENETSIGWRYLLDTFRAGKALHGWEDIRTAAGSYPLDGVGYQTLTAPNGQTALELVAMEQPDLVLLDVKMPGMSGYEVCQRIREFSTTPIIMLTALANAHSNRYSVAVRRASSPRAVTRCWTKSISRSPARTTGDPSGRSASSTRRRTARTLARSSCAPKGLVT